MKMLLALLPLHRDKGKSTFLQRFRQSESSNHKPGHSFSVHAENKVHRIVLEQHHEASPLIERLEVSFELLVAFASPQQVRLSVLLIALIFLLIRSAHYF